LSDPQENQNDPWKKMDEKLALFKKDLISELTVKNPNQKENISSGEKEHEHKEPAHLSLADLEKTDCPTCKGAIEEFGKKFHKKVMEERKDNPYECETCGERVKLEEENCPTCGGKKARRRD